MDRILLQGMEFYAYHGVFAEEARLGQRFTVDVELQTDLRKAGESDDLTETINYAEIFEIVKRTAQLERYKLVEAVAERIASRLLEHFPAVQSAKIKVTKLTPPIEGIMAGASVEIERGRR